jgi:hypothetical protein
MATAETTELSPPHAPKEASLAAYGEFEKQLKHSLIHERHEAAKHSLPYFDSISDVSDADLIAFSQSDFVLVRHAKVAYGHILFGKIHLPKLPGSGPSYIHFRAFEPEPGTEKSAELHSVHTERKEQSDGSFTYRALFTKDDPLEWFEY